MAEILIENHGSSREGVYPLLVLTAWRPEASELWLFFFTSLSFTRPAAWLLLIIDVFPLTCYLLQRVFENVS